MEETKNILDKTASELTVKDQLIVTAVAPIVAFAAVGAATVVAAASVNVYNKIKAQSNAVRENRRNRKLELVK